MDNNYDDFSSNNQIIFLSHILNNMYNDNLAQINTLIESIHNLNNSNDQIRNTLVQLLNINQENRNNTRNYSRRFNSNSNNVENNLPTDNTSSISYLINEYTIPINRNTNNNRYRNINNNRYRNTNTNNNRNTNNIRNNNINSLFPRQTIVDSYNILESLFQPVQIYPTLSQIEAATRRVRYCDIARPINMSCPISMDEFNDNDMVTVIRHCGHIFHNEHIMNWFRSNCRCPVCRYDIREYNSNVSNLFLNSTRDSSGNNIERNNNTMNNTQDSSGNNTNNTNNTTNNSTSHRNLFISSFFDLSGNYVNNQLDNELYNVFNAFNRNRNV